MDEKTNFSTAEDSQQQLLEGFCDPARSSVIKSYGKGGWFWPKNCEQYNPENPISRLPARPLDLLDTMTFLCWSNTNWIIRAGGPYLVRACMKRHALRSVWSYLQLLQDMGLLKMIVYDHDLGNIYLVNPILMRTAEAKKMANYKQASQLVCTAPEKKAKEKRMTRDDQLKILQEYAAIELGAPL